MKELNYGYHFHKGFLVIIPLPGGPSIYSYLDEVVAELSPKIPSFKRKRILCEGTDGYWNLILPAGRWGLRKMRIYSLNVLTLAEAEVEIRELIASGKILK